jgi:hypothetical protein
VLSILRYFNEWKGGQSGADVCAILEYVARYGGDGGVPPLDRVLDVLDVVALTCPPQSIVDIFGVGCGTVALVEGMVRAREKARGGDSEAATRSLASAAADEARLLRLLNVLVAMVDSATGPPKQEDGEGADEAWPGLLTPDEAARAKGTLYAAWARFLPLLHRSGLRTVAPPTVESPIDGEGLAGLVWRVEAGCRVDPTSLDRGAAGAWVSSVNALLRHLTTTPVAVPALDCLDTLRSRYLRVPDLAELQVADGAWRRSVLLQVQLYMVRVRALERADTPQSLQSAAKTWPPIISSLLAATGPDAAVLRSALGVLVQVEEGTLSWVGAGRPSFETAPTAVRAAAAARRTRIGAKRGRDEADTDMADVSGGGGEKGSDGGEDDEGVVDGTAAATLAAVVQPLRDQLQVGSDFSIAEDDVLRWQLARSAMREHMGIVSGLVRARKASQVIELVDGAIAAAQEAPETPTDEKDEAPPTPPPSDGGSDEAPTEEGTSAPADEEGEAGEEAAVPAGEAGDAAMDEA